MSDCRQTRAAAKQLMRRVYLGQGLFCENELPQNRMKYCGSQAIAFRCSSVWGHVSRVRPKSI